MVICFDCTSIEKKLATGFLVSFFLFSFKFLGLFVSLRCYLNKIDFLQKSLCLKSNSDLCQNIDSDLSQNIDTSKEELIRCP